jgi:hypothetical protein
MARGNQEAGAAEKDPKKNKMEAVRRALNEKGWDASLEDLQQHVNEHFGHNMDRKMISSYKTSIKAKAGIKKGRKKRGRKKKGEGEPAAVEAAGANRTKTGFSVEDIRGLKELASRVGVKRLREMFDLLY